MVNTTASVVLENNTDFEVVFGLFNGPDNEAKTHNVGPHVTTTIAIAHPDARVIGAWLADQNGQMLYPDNANPYVTGGLLEAGKSYKVVLDTGGISFCEA